MKKRVPEVGVFEWRAGWMPGIYLGENETLDVIRQKAKLCLDSGFPLYIDDKKFSSNRAQSQMLTTVQNLGFVTMMVDTVNDNKCPGKWYVCRIIDFIDNTNMNRFGLVSTRVRKALAGHIEEDIDPESYCWTPPEDYKFEELWVSCSINVAEVDN